MGFGGGGSGIGSAIDVALSNPADSNVLSYRGSDSKWVNKVVPAGAKGDNGDLAVATSAGTAVVWNTAGSPYDISGLAFPNTIHRVISGNFIISALPVPSSTVSGTLSFVFKLSTSASSSYTITWPSGVYIDPAHNTSFTSDPGNFTIYHLFWIGTRWTLTKQGDYNFAV